jgi:hypothetical protein
MGLLKSSSKPPKNNSSKKSVADDKPPPVFTQHADEDLRKGSKDPAQILSATNASSQQIWIAASNADAKKKQNQQQNQQLERRQSLSSHGSYLEEIIDESSYYDEEIIEEETVVEGSDFAYNLPPRKITLRFDEFDEMQTILHINDYTGHEINKAWYKREDYDKMVLLARKTAEKVEERRKELGKIDKTKKPIESRGLEAWTQMGATKVRMLKESAVEAVWNEQSRQWDVGTYDPIRISNAYASISKGSQMSAQDRAFSDELIAKRIREQEVAKQEKKQKRKLLGKSKDLVKKTAKATRGGVVNTTKLVGKTTKLTGKVALETTKRTVKAGVATATLDRKMLKEALNVKTKKREVERQFIRMPSQSSMDALKLTEGANGPFGTLLFACSVFCV